MASLETLIIHFNDELIRLADNGDTFTGIDTASEHAPRLRQVQFYGALLETDALRVPWSRMTDLCLQNVYFNVDITPFIHELVNLENFTLEVQYINDDGIVHAFPMTTIPNLRYLNLICWPNGMMSLWLFECVTLPALKELKLESVEFEVFPHSTFIRMNERSGFQFEKFTVSRVIMASVAHVRDVLGCMPSLLSFETEEDFHCHSEIRRALVYNRKWPVLPLLQEVRFLGDPPRPTFAETFAKVIESRWWPTIHRMISGASHRND